MALQSHHVIGPDSNYLRMIGGRVINLSNHKRGTSDIDS